MLKIRNGIFFCGLMLILLLISIWAISIGTVQLNLIDIQKALMYIFNPNFSLTESGHGIENDIIWLIRIPRILLVILAGAGVAISGGVMQAIVQNPLADPYILGVSSGASLGATIAIFFNVGIYWGSNFVGIMAFLGALMISALVLFVANLGGRTNSMKLLLSGISLSAVCSAFSSFIVYFADDKDGIKTVIYWMMGSFAGTRWENLYVVAPVVIILIVFFYTQSKILNLMLLGDETAITLGTDLAKYRYVFLLGSALLVAMVVFSAGMIGFVGLIVPHIVRMLIGTEHRILLPFCAITGAIFLLIADSLCRTLLPATEIPIGILISLIGAPCFVYLMIKKTYGFGGN